MYADDRLTLRFESSHPRSPDTGRALREMVQFVVAERETAWESDLVAASMSRHVAARIVELFPWRHDPVDRPVTARALLTGYRRAMRYIDDYASLPITVEDIAEAAGLPSAQLDAAFRGTPRRVERRATWCDRCVWPPLTATSWPPARGTPFARSPCAGVSRPRVSRAPTVDTSASSRRSCSSTARRRGLPTRLRVASDPRPRPRAGMRRDRAAARRAFGGAGASGENQPCSMDR